MPRSDIGLASRRPTLYGRRHAIAAGHYLAAAAGFSVLEAGGNAIDAGCAAGVSLAVLCPFEVSAGGVAPIMIRSADVTVVTLAGLGHWPRSIPADLFLRAEDQKSAADAYAQGGGRRLDRPPAAPARARPTPPVGSGRCKRTVVA